MEMIEIAGRQLPRNTACLTCEHVLSGDFVEHVFLDEEGDFQFLCDRPHTAEHAKVVAVDEIVEIDKMLTKLPELIEGQHARRNGISWVIC